MKKILKIMLGSLALLFFAVSPALAHVVVKPNQVGIGTFQTFTVGVPNEKESTTVGLRLIIPEGLKHVSPNVKPGWKIEVKTDYEGMKGATLNTGQEAPTKATEIIWTGGSIPVGQRDDFFFSAQVPTNETTITWKAYQTYEDGTIVSWDQEKAKDDHNNDFSQKGPASQTKIVNDLTNVKTERSSNLPIQLSIVALIFSLVALGLQLRKK